MVERLSVKAHPCGCKKGLARSYFTEFGHPANRQGYTPESMLPNLSEVLFRRLLRQHRQKVVDHLILTTQILGAIPDKHVPNKSYAPEQIQPERETVIALLSRHMFIVYQQRFFLAMTQVSRSNLEIIFGFDFVGPMALEKREVSASLSRLAGYREASLLPYHMWAGQTVCKPPRMFRRPYGVR